MCQVIIHTHTHDCKKGQSYTRIHTITFFSCYTSFLDLKTMKQRLNISVSTKTVDIINLIQEQNNFNLSQITHNK